MWYGSASILLGAKPMRSNFHENWTVCRSLWTAKSDLRVALTASASIRKPILNKKGLFSTIPPLLSSEYARPRQKQGNGDRQVHSVGHTEGKW